MDTDVFQFFLDEMAKAVPKKEGVRQAKEHAVVQRIVIAREPLVTLLDEVGAHGYMLFGVEGKGSRGVRSGEMQEFANIQGEVIVPPTWRNSCWKGCRRNSSRSSRWLRTIPRCACCAAKNSERGVGGSANWHRKKSGEKLGALFGGERYPPDTPIYE